MPAEGVRELEEVAVVERAPDRLPQLVLRDRVEPALRDVSGVVTVDHLTDEPRVRDAARAPGQRPRARTPGGTAYAASSRQPSTPRSSQWSARRSRSARPPGSTWSSATSVVVTFEGRRAVAVRPATEPVVPAPSNRERADVVEDSVEQRRAGREREPRPRAGRSPRRHRAAGRSGNGPRCRTRASPTRTPAQAVARSNQARRRTPASPPASANDERPPPRTRADRPATRSLDQPTSVLLTAPAVWISCWTADRRCAAGSTRAWRSRPRRWR